MTAPEFKKLGVSQRWLRLSIGRSITNVDKELKQARSALKAFVSKSGTEYQLMAKQFRETIEILDQHKAACEARRVALDNTIKAAKALATGKS